MEGLFQARLASLPLNSILEVCSEDFTNSSLKAYCAAKSLNYQSCFPADCEKLSSRVDFAFIHNIESYALDDIRKCIGLLKNLLSERIWLLVAKDYGSPQEWISLGFKTDPTPDAMAQASYSYNLETYNNKREWNNSRFWANPENWNKRF